MSSEETDVWGSTVNAAISMLFLQIAEIVVSGSCPEWVMVILRFKDLFTHLIGSVLGFGASAETHPGWIHSANGCSGSGWTKLKPGAWNSLWVSPMGSGAHGSRPLLPSQVLCQAATELHAVVVGSDLTRYPTQALGILL